MFKQDAMDLDLFLLEKEIEDKLARQQALFQLKAEFPFGDNLQKRKDEAPKKANPDEGFASKRNPEMPNNRIAYRINFGSDKDIEDFIKEAEAEEKASIINDRVDELRSEGKSITEIEVDSDLSNSTVKRLRQYNRKDYIPDKINLIKFAVGLELDIDGANQLLEAFGYFFSASSRFDLICVYFFTYYEYERKDRGSGKAIYELNNILVGKDQKAISSY